MSFKKILERSEKLQEEMHRHIDSLTKDKGLTYQGGVNVFFLLKIAELELKFEELIPAVR